MTKLVIRLALLLAMLIGGLSGPGAASASASPTPTGNAADTAATSRTLAVGPAPEASAADPVPTNCPDGRQIGNTVEVKWNGTKIASVKQYYSPGCRANWSYVYMWESFRSRNLYWSTHAWIDAKSDSTAWGFVSRDNWIHTYSTPVGTVNLCTRAVTEIWIYRTPLKGIPLGHVNATATAFRPAGC